MKTILERLKEAEKKILSLAGKVNDLSLNTESKSTKPYTKLGGWDGKQFNSPRDLKSRRTMLGKPIFWNDSEVNNPRGELIPEPDVGYHWHPHSRFGGGALIKDVLEIVEFDWTKAVDGTSQVIPAVSRHSPGFFPKQPKIVTEINSEGKKIEKIGKLDLVFNPDTLTWGTVTYGIDVEKTFFVKKRREANKDEYGNVIEGEDVGDIEKDENDHEMKSPLYVIDAEGNYDVTNSSVIWDINGRGGQGCFRLLAVYASEPETEE